LLLPPAARPLLHALLLQGVAHGYGVELDRVKVAKAEAFCKGVLEELSQRGMFAGGGEAAAAAAEKQKVLLQETAAPDVDGSAAEDQHKQQTHEESVNPQPCSGVSQHTALSNGASSQASTAADGVKAAAGDAAARSGKGSGKSSRSKVLLQQPQSSPIITCASIEQVR
jgi:hypothetical protein